jgi:hypothetical protein
MARKTAREARALPIPVSEFGFKCIFPPGGTPRLYGRQAARRHGKATECANANMNCHRIRFNSESHFPFPE